MKLNWQLDPRHLNVQKALSAAYQYRVQEWNDGQTELTVQHRGDRPSGTPIKNFVYRNRKAAHNGAQRFEDKHGCADPAHHAPAAVVPFLRPFSERTRQFITDAQEQAQGKVAILDVGDVLTYVEMATEEYDALCDELLCCRVYDCYNRTEPGAQQCATCRTAHETTED